MFRNELENYLNQLLDISRFRDYCPNGLQVEGRDRIHKIVTGVTASLELLETAIACKADTVLVHHGYFWRGEDACITGMKGRRIAMLIKNELNLFAYHLPLDIHPQLGNNAQLAKRLEFFETGRFGEQDIAIRGELIKAMPLHALGAKISLSLAREPLVVGNSDRTIKKIAWCTGAAQSYFDAAIAQGVDVFITGEISEQTVHAARESGVAFIAAGHHATERYGVQALGEHLAREFGIQHQFIDIDNPV
ncbi:Nif3-like dinuclear metal center hexameric protein [Nitrosomonas aestuarii]|uniref:Nif3-like dinuclear metal center hexameric protein n=1 Tax=Nitrosomonas aestuarii TaxID=52441 RepID=UPI000D2FC993|nr:Nif3-like dinuclear metal center hexameric protein [Nitrosomonas aestuarii]PTN11461.1 dinuclear metal center YbgI/SA1388 family protein [Nitrosomonas aestuarii]